MKIFKNGGHNLDFEIYNNFVAVDSEISGIIYAMDPWLPETMARQIFISFTTDGKGIGKGFTAKIIFGIRNNC